MPTFMRPPMGSIHNTFRAQFDQLRRTRRLTFEHLAEVTGISVTALRRIASGERRVDLEEVPSIAGALGTTPLRMLPDLTGCSVCGGTPPEHFTCQACGSVGLPAERRVYDNMNDALVALDDAIAKRHPQGSPGGGLDTIQAALDKIEGRW